LVVFLAPARGHNCRGKLGSEALRKGERGEMLHAEEVGRGHEEGFDTLYSLGGLRLGRDLGGGNPGASKRDSGLVRNGGGHHTTPLDSGPIPEWPECHWEVRKKGEWKEEGGRMPEGFLVVDITRA